MGDQSVLTFSMSGSVSQEIATSMKYLRKMIEEIIHSGTIPILDFPEYCQTNIAVSTFTMSTSFYSVKSYIESYYFEISHKLETQTAQMDKSEGELSVIKQNLKTIELEISQCNREIDEVTTQKQNAEERIEEIERKITELDKQKENASSAQVLTLGVTVLGGIVFPPSLWLTGPAAGFTVGAIEANKSKLSEQLSFERLGKENYVKSLKEKQKIIENLRKEQKYCTKNLNEAKAKNYRTADEIAKVKQQINKTTDLLAKIRRVCTSVDSVYGAMSVIKQETKNAYAWAPLIFPLKELFKYLQDLIYTFPVEYQIQMIQTLQEIHVMSTNIQSIESPPSDCNDLF